MCNNILWDDTVNPKKIPEVGVGWKLFYSMTGDRAPTSELRPRFGVTHINYLRESDGWINWQGTLNKEQGFCFFLKEEDAEKMKAESPLEGCSVIRKIEYEQGVQERTQRSIISDDDEWRMALCKRFRILEEKENV